MDLYVKPDPTETGWLLENMLNLVPANNLNQIAEQQLQDR